MMIDVTEWLRGLGLEQYASAFHDNEIDERVLPSLTAEDLKDLGVTLVGHRRRLLDAIAGLGSAVPAAAVTATPGDAPAQADAERRQLTVMFCDLVGSTSLSSRLDPEDLREVIAAYHRAVAEVVAGLDGFVAKYMGDGVLVYFGYPRAHEDDAERAVRAGLGSIHAVGRLEANSTKLQARVGIATGLVVVGDLIGEGSAREQSVVGETPNLAARLQSLAEPNAVVIAAGTRRLVGDLFEYRDLGAVEVKGIAGPVPAWQVLRPSAIESRFEALRSCRTRLIGREEELDLLQRRWNQAKKTGEGRVVFVWGEPGIGKSRLVAALQDIVHVEPHACLRFFCSPHRTQTALHPVINQLERTAGFEPADSADTKLDKLESLLALSSQEVNRDTALFASLLSISTSGRYTALSVSPQRRKELFLERFIAQLVALAARQPVLMILEDAHWIDPTTCELFDILIERIRRLPVLLVITYRPEFVPPWLGQSHVTALMLNRLDPRENAIMIKHIASDRELPPLALEHIIARTDGIPLFIEEMTINVLESGILCVEDEAHVVAAPLPALAVPPTLQASLVARLDRLAPARAVIQAGAALGREFNYRTIKAVTKLEDDELAPYLHQLVASQLIHQRGAVPDALYTFKHVLVQDAAYGTLLRSQRVDLHKRIVEVLEEESTDTRERDPDLLAYHSTEAGLWEKAIDYWLKAARMALERSAGSEAHAQVEKAIALLPKIGESAARRQLEGRVQVGLGEALVMTKGFASPDVAAALSEARGLLDELKHPIESLRAVCGLFNYHMIRSDCPKGLELALPVLQRPIDQATAAVTHFLIGTAYLHMGKLHDSRHHLEQSLILYEEESCHSIAFVAGYHVKSLALTWLGHGYLYAGSFDQAANTISAAVADARSRAHPFTLVSVLLAHARFLHYTGEMERASAVIEEGFTVASEQRSPYHLSRAGILRAWNVVASGRPEEGIILMERALAAHRDTGANYQSSYNFSRLAEAHDRAGKIDCAIRLATQAVEEVERSGERWWEAEAHRIRGEILLAAAPPDRDEAEACFKRSFEVARREGANFWKLRAAQSLASLWSMTGRDNEARTLLGATYREFTDGFELPVLRDAKELLNQLTHRRAVERTLSRPQQRGS